MEALRLAKAALAKTSNIENGTVGTTDPRTTTLATSLGVTFNGNLVSTNNTNDRLSTNENNISSLLTRTSTNETDIGTMTNLNSSEVNLVDALNIVISKVNSISTLFGITFNADGTIASEAYTTHKHNYVDDTINDTTDGSGIITSTNKVTGNVNP